MGLTCGIRHMSLVERQINVLSMRRSPVSHRRLVHAACMQQPPPSLSKNSAQNSHTFLVFVILLNKLQIIIFF